MRVAVIDIGTNSTRLLIADVSDGEPFQEIERQSVVTRLGAGVDASGRLSDEGMARVYETLDRFCVAIDGGAVETSTAVMTSAVRDAANGADFSAQVRERFGIEARAIGGDEEAALTFAGATSERPKGNEEIVVVDIGGGSTEFVAGRDGEVDFHVSTQAGVVRQSERHLHQDPPPPEGLQALAEEVATIIDGAVPRELRARVGTAIAVAGTATSCAAIELELDPYDRALVHGHVLELGTLEMLLARLAQMTDDERRQVIGLQPDRAPTIVAGVAMLLEVLRAFGLDQVEVSEHDILRGTALRLAAQSHSGSQ